MPSTKTDYPERRSGQRRLMTQRRLCSVQEVSEWIRCQPGSLRDPRYRSRLGLAAIRIGGRLMFSQDDVESYIKRRRETLPAMPSEENGHAN